MDIKRFLTQTVTIERRSTQNAYSGHSYAAPVTVSARWATATRLLQGKDGGEVVSDTHFSTLTLVTEGDRVTDEAGRARTVVRVRRNRDTRGHFTHYVAYLA